MAAQQGAIKYLTTDMGRDELTKIVRWYIGKERKEQPSVYSEFMKDVSTTEFYEEAMTIGGFGDAPLLDEGDYINLAKSPFGDIIRAQPETHQLGFVISEDDKQFNRIGKVETLSQKLSVAMRRTKERAAMLVLNDGFAGTNHRTTDNQPLFSTAHVLLNGDTVGNRPASDVDLTMASLEAAITNFMLQQDEDGTYMSVEPRYLVVHPSEYLNATRLLESKNYFTGGVPSAADTGVPNVISRMGLKVIASPYLTDPDAWFLLGDKNDSSLRMITNRKLRDWSFQDNWTRDFVYGMDERYVAYAADWHGTYGSTGA